MIISLFLFFSSSHSLVKELKKKNVSISFINNHKQQQPFERTKI